MTEEEEAINRIGKLLQLLPAVQQRRWQTMLIGGTRRHSANSLRSF